MGKQQSQRQTWGWTSSYALWIRLHSSPCYQKKKKPKTTPRGLVACPNVFLSNSVIVEALSKTKYKTSLWTFSFLSLSYLHMSFPRAFWCQSNCFPKIFRNILCERCIETSSPFCLAEDGERSFKTHLYYRGGQYNFCCLWQLGHKISVIFPVVSVFLSYWDKACQQMTQEWTSHFCSFSRALGGGLN